MPVPIAELSSVCSALDDLTKRVSAIAEQAAAEHDEENASELFAIERSLTGARRRLQRMTSAKPRSR